MWPGPLPSWHDGAVLIDLLGALLIVGYDGAAIVALLRGRSILQARLLVAEGAVFGLSFKVAGALLTALELPTWRQLGMFATVLALRTLLKQLFACPRPTYP